MFPLVAVKHFLCRKKSDLIGTKELYTTVCNLSLNVFINRASQSVTGGLKFYLSTELFKLLRVEDYHKVKGLQQPDKAAKNILTREAA